MNCVYHLLVAGIILVLVANDEAEGQRGRYGRRRLSTCRYKKPQRYEATYNRWRRHGVEAKLPAIFYRCWRAARRYDSLPVCSGYTRRSGMACRRAETKATPPKSQCQDKKPVASCDKYAKAGRCLEDEEIVEKCERTCRACPEFGPLDAFFKSIGGRDKLANISIDDVPGLRQKPHVQQMLQDAGVIEKGKAAAVHSVTIRGEMNSTGLFFDVRKHLADMKLIKARIFVHMEEPRQSNVQIKIYKIKGGKRGSMAWVSHGLSAGQPLTDGTCTVSVTRLVKEWLRQAPTDQLGLYITAEAGGQQLAMVAADGEHATLLELDTYMRARPRRSTSDDCEHNRVCCRKDNWVNFDDHDSMAVAQPKIYNAYKCTGSCTPITDDGKKLPGYTPALKTRTTCCHGADYSGVNIAYMEPDHSVKSVTLPNAVILRCACGDWSNDPVPDFPA